jgi:hypothetical protein
MIYTLPRNQAIMDLFHQSDAPNVVLARIAEGLTNRGYVLNGLKVFACGIGDLCVDADRDPSADWANFSPPARTTDEQNALDTKRQLKAGYDLLTSNYQELTDATSYNALTAAQKLDLIRSDLAEVTLVVGRLYPSSTSRGYSIDWHHHEDHAAIVDSSTN